MPASGAGNGSSNLPGAMKWMRSKNEILWRVRENNFSENIETVGFDMNYKKAKIIAAEIAIALSIDFGLLGSLYLKPLYLSEKIETKERLSIIINEEKGKIGLAGVHIEYEFEPSDDSCFGYSSRLDENEFEIYIGKGNTRDVVKHELYHIYRMNKQGKYMWSKFMYGFVEEPLAILYGATGIKI